MHLVPADHRSEIVDDIDLLQLSSTNDIFEKAKVCFIKKYTKICTEFIPYMNKSWFTSHDKWYEGISNFLPSTNNALESHNLVIKKEETLRERMPLSRFLPKCVEVTKKWSSSYDFGNVFAKEPSVHLND